MGLGEFVRLVGEMRSAQRSYFKTRSTADLDRSKRLEKQVDEAVRALLDDRPRLFDPE